MGYMRVITHLLTIDPNFQQDILVADGDLSERLKEMSDGSMDQ